ncbi:MAG: ABC transporter substrate-binding protein [Nitratireductor sp.]|nr:ABC transporter substrate-binding protein [Nitratireductor sp.]
MAFLSAIMLAIAISLHAAQPARSEGFRIGLSLPMSGNASLLGKQFLQGARLALDVLAPGGEIELMVADDGCETDIARLAMAEIAAARPALVSGLLCNEPARLAVETFAPQPVPVLVAGARSERLLKDAAKEGWRTWRLAPSDKAGAEAAFRLLSQRWKGIPWAVVDDGTVYGRTIADEFRARMEEFGNPPQFADNFRPAQSTQAGLIRRLQKAGVSAAFIAASPEDTAIIAANTSEFGAKFEIAGGETLSGLPFTQEASNVPDGLLAVMETSPASRPGARSLNALLEQRGIEPEPEVYRGYATIEIALAALRSTPVQTMEALERTVFRTVLGNVGFDSTGANVADNYALHVWVGGEFVPVEASR